VRTSVGALAALFLLAAGLLYVTVTLPARQAVAAAQDAFGRVRDERLRLRARLAEREQQAAAEDRAAAALAAAAGGPGDAVVHVRRSVVGSLEGAVVSGVRLTVTSGRAPVGAKLRFSAEGRYGEALRLTGHLARPGSGLVLESVRFRPSPAGLTLELTGFSLEGRP